MNYSTDKNKKIDLEPIYRQTLKDFSFEKLIIKSKHDYKPK